jgi:hypothetical protein
MCVSLMCQIIAPLNMQKSTLLVKLAEFMKLELV